MKRIETRIEYFLLNSQSMYVVIGFKYIRWDLSIYKYHSLKKHTRFSLYILQHLKISWSPCRVKILQENASFSSM